MEESRLKQMLEFAVFLYEQGILEEECKITFFENEVSNYNFSENCININISEIEGLQWKCFEEIYGQTDKFMVTLAHEVGHKIDIENRLKSNQKKIKKILENRMAVMKKANEFSNKIVEMYDDLFENHPNGDEILQKLSYLESKFYRSLPLEVEADRTALRLLDFYKKNS